MAQQIPIETVRKWLDDSGKYIANLQDARPIEKQEYLTGRQASLSWLHGKLNDYEDQQERPKGFREFTDEDLERKSGPV